MNGREFKGIFNLGKRNKIAIEAKAEFICNKQNLNVIICHYKNHLVSFCN